MRNRTIDLSQLSVPQLLEIRRILSGGVEAVATVESKAGKLARALRAENEKLKREKQVRETVLGYALDFDDDPDFYLNLDKQGALDFICRKLAIAQKEAAFAEKTNTIRIPPIVHAEELSGVDLVRQGFNTLRNRRNGHED